MIIEFIVKDLVYDVVIRGVCYKMDKIEKRSQVSAWNRCKKNETIGAITLIVS